MPDHHNVVVYSGVLVRRHSGVLGLAALVEACPYSVPEWLPEVLVEVALHNHDPAPIRVSFFGQYFWVITPY